MTNNNTTQHFVNLADGLRHNYYMYSNHNFSDMDVSTPILAAIIGSVVAGVVSLVVNIISIFGQYKMNQRNRRSMNESQWRRDTISFVKELRREVLRMNMDGEDDDITKSVVSELESQIDRVPSAYNGSSIISGLESICVTNLDFEGDDITRAGYRQEMIDKTEDVLDNFENDSNSPDSLY